MKLSELEMLIDKYLSGKATEEEKEIVNNWLQHNPADQIADPQKRQDLITAIWGNVMMKISQPDTATTALAERSAVVRSIEWLQKKYLIRIAASLLLMTTAGILFYYFTNRNSTKTTQYASVTASDSTAMEHLLPDGSKAWLFPGSAIHIPANYNEQHRQVQVTGRAFFEVKQDISKPFYVDAGAMQTRVLGTSFEVNTIREKYPAVVVKSGRVAVSWEGKELSQLSVNKRITLDLTGELPHATTDSVNAMAICTWWSGAFNFEQTPLTEILENLSQWYRLPISVQGKKWQQEKLTIQIETQLNLRDAMRLLCETLGAQYKMNGQSISIY